MRWIAIALLLIAPNVWAQPVLIDVDADRLLTEQEQIQEKERLRGKISYKLTPIKADYAEPWRRGSVKYDPSTRAHPMHGEIVPVVRDYSRHVVTIPDGTTLNGVNFSQAKPGTVAIIGKDLHFIGCNLTNVKLDPTWTYDSTLRISIKKVAKSHSIVDGMHQVDVEHWVKKPAARKFELIKTDTKLLSDEQYADLMNRVEVQNR